MKGSKKGRKGGREEIKRAKRNKWMNDQGLLAQSCND